MPFRRSAPHASEDTHWLVKFGLDFWPTPALRDARLFAVREKEDGPSGQSRGQVFPLPMNGVRPRERQQHDGAGGGTKHETDARTDGS